MIINMWSKEVTIETNATPEQIWKLWSDVKNWNQWDEEIEMSELYGGFEVGVKGVLKPKGGPKTKFEMLTVDYLRGFSDRSFLPLTKMDFIHKLEEKNGKLFITHRVEIKGTLTFLFSRVIGNKIASELPKAMKKLSEMAEKV